MGVNLQRATEFLDKAEKWLGWSDQDYTAIIASAMEGDFPEIERHFVSVLLRLDVIHLALTAAARMLGKPDWGSDLDALRAKDPLLRYMWNARRTEAHNSVPLKWRPSAKQLRLDYVLPETVRIIQWGARNPEEESRRLFYRVFNVNSDPELFAKIRDGHFPTPAEQLIRAGVRLRPPLDSLALDRFEFKDNQTTVVVLPPEEHLGQILPPSAIEAARLAISFYRSKLREL